MTVNVWMCDCAYRCVLILSLLACDFHFLWCFCFFPKKPFANISTPVSFSLFHRPDASLRSQWGPGRPGASVPDVRPKLHPPEEAQDFPWARVGGPTGRHTHHLGDRRHHLPRTFFLPASWRGNWLWGEGEWGGIGGNRGSGERVILVIRREERNSKISGNYRMVVNFKM